MPVLEVPTRSPRYSGALPKVQADINGAPAVGMMDTGSQINLMTEEYWMKTGLPINEGRKIRMQGVNLTGDQSMGLCEHVEIPFAGVVTRAHFHVFKKGPYPFILGQPWIQDHLIANTETGSTNKILIRDFRDPKNRVTMILRHDTELPARGDLPTVMEMGMPPPEVSAYVGIIEDCAVEPEVFDQREEGAGGLVFWQAALKHSVSPRFPKEEPEREGVAYFGGAASWANARVLKWVQDEVVPIVAATKYKPVNKKVRPVPGVMPEEARTIRRFPSDPLAGYEPPPLDPPPFKDGVRVTRKRLDDAAYFKSNFLWPEKSESPNTS